MNPEIISMVKRFNNWCALTGVKNSFANYIWWKDNVMKKRGK